MKPKESKEYEAIPTPEGRAKWLIKKGVKGKIVMDTKTMSISYRAAVLDAVLPTGNHASEEEAIAAGTAWLAEKAGLANASADLPPNG